MEPIEKAAIMPGVLLARAEVNTCSMPVSCTSTRLIIESVPSQNDLNALEGSPGSLDTKRRKRLLPRVPGHCIAFNIIFS